MTVKARSILFLLIPVFVLLIAVEGIAQGVQTPNTQEITGSVDAFTMTTITVNAQVIDIAQAQITGTIMLGATVRVHVTVALDGTVVATEVVVMPPFFGTPQANHGQDEIDGQVEALTATTITINGQVIDIAQAEITGTIMLGATVRVHVMVAVDGSLVAREIVVMPPFFSTEEVNGEDFNATPEATDDHGQDFNATPEATDDHGGDGGATQGEDGNRGQNSGDSQGQQVVATHSVNVTHGDDSGSHDAGDDHGQSTPPPPAPVSIQPTQAVQSGDSGQQDGGGDGGGQQGGDGGHHGG